MLPFDHDTAELFLDRGISLPSRALYIGSMEALGGEHSEDNADEPGVDFRLADKVIKGLHVLNSMGQDPITIILNNIGGDEYHGLGIYDAIKSSKSPTKLIVYGSAMSMGSVILQAATKRYLAPNATVMIHMGSVNTHIDQRDVEAFSKEQKRMNEVINNIYLERLREKTKYYSTNQLKELLETDRYLSATEAVNLGLADEVLK